MPSPSYKKWKKILQLRGLLRGSSNSPLTLYRDDLGEYAFAGPYDIVSWIDRLAPLRIVPGSGPHGENSVLVPCFGKGSRRWVQAITVKSAIALIEYFPDWELQLDKELYDLYKLMELADSYGTITS